MLSYIHDYHCGNFADVLKHICLCLILNSLCKKEKPFTVIDSHSGSGRFDLTGEHITKTGEAKTGIKKLLSYVSEIKEDNIPEEIKLYLEKENPYLEKSLYAGSAELERLFLRKGDVLHLNDLHPSVFETLSLNSKMPLIKKEGLFPCNGKTFLHKEDAFKNLISLTPPLVKRGLVFCDPSFEDAEDYRKVTDTLKTVRKKWNTAVIALWYPLIKRRKNETALMLASLEDFGKLGNQNVESLRIEVNFKDPNSISDDEEKSHLYGSGFYVMNPPWLLKEQFETVRNFLQKVYLF